MKTLVKKLVKIIVPVICIALFPGRANAIDAFLGEVDYGWLAFQPYGYSSYIDSTGDTLVEGKNWEYCLSSFAPLEVTSSDESILSVAYYTKAEFYEDDTKAGYVAGWGGYLYPKKAGKVTLDFMLKEIGKSEKLDFYVVHDFDESQGIETVKEATCTEDGQVKKYCNYCKEWQVETVKALGHIYQYHQADETHDAPYKKCSECNGEAELTIPTDFQVQYYNETAGAFTSATPKYLTEGTNVKFQGSAFIPDDAEVTDIVATSSDDTVITINENELCPKQAGRATITFRSKYGDRATVTETFEVRHDYTFYTPQTSSQVGYKVCKVCGHKESMICLQDFSVYWNFTEGIGDFTENFESNVSKGIEFFYGVSNLIPEEKELDNKIVNVTSSNSKVLKVNPITNSIQAVGSGEATITFAAKYAPSVKKTYKFNVPWINPTIKLSATSKTIKKKKSFTLTVSKLVEGDSVKNIKASNRNIKITKTSNNKYKIKGVKKGKVKVTVTLASGKTATCKIKVK